MTNGRGGSLLSAALNEMQTVSLLCELLYTQEPFVHCRFGDGDVFFATGTGPKITADGEEWSPVLAAQLRNAWIGLARPRQLLLGDLRTYAVSDGCEEQWDELLAEMRAVRLSTRPITFVHMEALRVGFGYAAPFYQAVRDDPRSKMYVAPERLAPVAEWLGCDHFAVPLHTAHEETRWVTAWVDGYDLVLFSAGRGGKIMQSELTARSPKTTQVDVGSGLDLLIPDGVRRGTDLGVKRRKVLAEYRELGWTG